MTEDFVINILEQYKEKPTLINEIETIEEAAWLDEALNIAIMAIKALKQKSCNDAISRQDVLSYIYNDLGLGDEENEKDLERQVELENSYEYIKSLPTVTSPSKMGYWIDADGDDAICGCCNRLNHLYGAYCKHCGAKMIKKE